MWQKCHGKVNENQTHQEFECILFSEVTGKHTSNKKLRTVEAIAMSKKFVDQSKHEPRTDICSNGHRIMFLVAFIVSI